MRYKITLEYDFEGTEQELTDNPEVDDDLSDMIRSGEYSVEPLE